MVEKLAEFDKLVGQYEAVLRSAVGRELMQEAA